MKNLMIFFVLCASLFAQSNINEDTIHFVGQASAFTVGSEFVTNGGFATDTVWTKTNGTPSGWAIAAGVATCSGSQSVDTDLTQVIASGFTVGRLYRMQFEITVYSAGTVTARFDAVEIGDKSAVGVYTGYGVATGTGLSINIRGDLNFIGTIDNVSVVAWVGDVDAGGGCTIATFTGTLTDYMTATGGVLHAEAGLGLNDDVGNLEIDKGVPGWDQAPIVGTFVKCDFSATFTDGVYEIIGTSGDTVTIDLSSGGLGAETVEVWIGGAYPDIATAVNASTLSEDPDGTYRKRYICVNVDQEIDAVTDFVAETSETALCEDDGSRKIIGFYDSISVANLGAGGGTYGYRVVSDMDFGQTYYAGARKAFNQDESFPVINPNGKWIEWNAKGNDINILELNTSNVEFRNLKIHNTIADDTAEGLIHIDTSNFNTTFINCWFADSSLFIVNDTPVAIGNSVVDCYFSDSIDSMNIADFQESLFVNCIVNGTGRSAGVEGTKGCYFNYCSFYKGTRCIVPSTSAGKIGVSNCTFFDYTEAGIKFNSNDARLLLFYNNIFSPVAAADQAIFIVKGSMTGAGFNNIMYSVTAGAVLTNPIVHDQVSPNPPLPVGTIEKDPLFVNPADGDFRLRASSPALNGGIRSLFNGWTTIGANQPYSSPNAGYRSRYNFKGHNYSDR